MTIILQMRETINRPLVDEALWHDREFSPESILTATLS
jgi:hypothetical protein